MRSRHARKQRFGRIQSGRCEAAAGKQGAAQCRAEGRVAVNIDIDCLDAWRSSVDVQLNCRARAWNIACGPDARCGGYDRPNPALREWAKLFGEMRFEQILILLATRPLQDQFRTGVQSGDSLHEPVDMGILGAFRPAKLRRQARMLRCHRGRTMPEAPQLPFENR